MQLIALRRGEQWGLRAPTHSALVTKATGMSPPQGDSCGLCPPVPQALEGAARVLAVPGAPGERGQSGPPGRAVSAPPRSQVTILGDAQA